MVFKAKLSLLLFLFSVFLFSATSSLAYESDPQQELRQCMQLCTRQPVLPQKQCEDLCEKRYRERQREEGHGLNTRDPQVEYQQCQSRCQQEERGQQPQCQRRCEERRREQEREQQRDAQDPQKEYQQCQSRCQQQERGEQPQCQRRCEERRREQEREQQRDASSLAYESDPQQELRQCMQLCKRQPVFPQKQCEDLCEKRYRERQREEGQGLNTRDPQEEYQQCQSRCQQEERGQQPQCQRRCEERRREQEREQQRDAQDPQREYQQCQSRCQQQERGEQPQCQRRCEERRREQEREQQRDAQDPQREYQQCKSRCQQQERGEQPQCQRHCEERRREQEREQQRDAQDPQREYQQCKSRCQQQERGEQPQCQRRCEERRREQEREKQRDAQDPQREYQQCKSRCQQQERGEQPQCQRRCEERRREQEREQQRDAQDPQREYQQCKSRCQQQERGEQPQCQRRCEERRREQEREQQRDAQDPQREYQQCQSRCQQQERGEQPQCQRRCEERRREQEREQQRDAQDPQREYQQCQSRCQQQEIGEQQRQCEQQCEQRRRSSEQQHGNNPYFFSEQSFVDRYRTQEGSIRVLPRFTEQSNLLRGIENYRLVIFEAKPNTFVVPNHWDAEAVLYVVRGRGTITLVRQQNRESYNLKQGDVLRVPVGSLVYMINRDNNEMLQIAKLFQTVSTPGQFREFFGAGGEEPESFYKIFSTDILEAAFNTPREKLDKLFGQSKGVIIKASQEQIKELSRHASSSSEGGHSLWPGSHELSKGPYNLLNKRPSHSNNYGQLFEVDGNDYKQLKDLDLSVLFTNISQGAMLGPYYNTRATKVVLVVEGSGKFEMACPHLSRQSQRGQGREEEGGASYQKVTAQLSPRTVFVIPAGHPVAIVASQNQNLQIVSFGINGQDNQRNFLAGRESVINQIEKEAMELGFNVPASEVKEILNKQKESYFLPGPNQRQQREERGQHGLSSILDFAGF